MRERDANRLLKFVAAALIIMGLIMAWVIAWIEPGIGALGFSIGITIVVAFFGLLYVLALRLCGPES